jgi:hypothetical protein
VTAPAELVGGDVAEGADVRVVVVAEPGVAVVADVVGMAGPPWRGAVVEVGGCERTGGRLDRVEPPHDPAASTTQGPLTAARVLTGPG